jgi:guanylate kinase
VGSEDQDRPTAGAAPPSRTVSPPAVHRGPLFILSGPSGSGKSTVLRKLLEDRTLPLRLSVSATTRPPRPGEIEGVHYHFWTLQRFEEELRRGEFLEWARVHGNYYGTLRREVEPYRERGVGVLLDIDVQGARQIRMLYPDAIAIFLRTNSLETYEQRLRQRGTEDEASLRRRLDAARGELAQAGGYEYQVVNEDLSAAVAELRAVVRRHFQGDALAERR